jgi:hypothetical protein
LRPRRVQQSNEHQSPAQKILGDTKKQTERSEKRFGCSQKSSIAAKKKKGVGPKKKGDAPEMNVVPTQQEPSADQKPDASGPNQPS